MVTYCLSELSLRNYLPSLYFALRNIENSKNNRRLQDNHLNELFNQTSFNEKSLRFLVNYDRKQRFLLPSAFEFKSIYAKWDTKDVLKARLRDFSPSFVTGATRLRRKIIEDALSGNKKSQSLSLSVPFPSDPYKWFISSGKIWDEWITQNTSLYEANSLRELEIDHVLSSCFFMTRREISNKINHSLFDHIISCLMATLESADMRMAIPEDVLQILQDQ
jgi:hypothetical protein